MSEHVREQLSALMDGELPAEERELLLRRLGTDAELRAWWQRQHRGREVMRNEASPGMNVDLAARVMRSIGDDAGDATAMPVADSDLTVKAAGSAWWRPVAGVAVAASVATVAVMGMQHFQTDGGAPTLVAERAPAGKVGIPLWAGQANPDITQVVSGPELHGQRDPRLDAYLASHAEEAMMLGSAGWLPHSRLVGRDRDLPVHVPADR